MEDNEDNKGLNDRTKEIEKNLDQDLEDYQKYKVNDITISSISYDDIEEKMNKLINFKNQDNLKFEDIKKTTEENANQLKKENQKNEKIM